MQQIVHKYPKLALCFSLAYRVGKAQAIMKKVQSLGGGEDKAFYG